MKKKPQNNAKAAKPIPPRRSDNRELLAGVQPAAADNWSKRSGSTTDVVAGMQAATKLVRTTNPIWGDDEPLHLEEAAAYTGMPLATFRARVYSRQIASVLVGRRRKVQPSAVRAYLALHMRPAL